MNRNSEKFSEKRGRKASPMKAIISGLYLDEGGRSQNNKASMIRALRVLDAKSNQAGYAWLFESTPQGKYKRHMLLYELGRIQNEETIKAFAAALCEQKPKSTEAARRIRNYRMTGEVLLKGNQLDLAIKLENCINQYLAYHNISANDIVQALNFVADEIQESA